MNQRSCSSKNTSCEKKHMKLLKHCTKKKNETTQTYHTTPIQYMLVKTVKKYASLELFHRNREALSREAGQLVVRDSSGSTS